MNKTIDLVLTRVSMATRNALIRFINGEADLNDREILNALYELVAFDKKISASYEELMADMFDDVLK